MEACRQALHSNFRSIWSDSAANLPHLLARREEYEPFIGDPRCAWVLAYCLCSVPGAGGEKVFPDWAAARLIWFSVSVV